MELNEEYNVPSAVPHKRSIIEDEELQHLKAKRVTRMPAPKAHAKAKKLTGKRSKEAITAPKVAPELIPIIPGSARGFLKNT